MASEDAVQIGDSLVEWLKATGNRGLGMAEYGAGTTSGITRCAF
jgi:hypothetical protein